MAVSVVSFTQTAWNDTTTPKSLTGLSWSSGDVIVVVGGIETADMSVSTPTNANLTFSLQASITTGTSSESPAYVWSATAGSSQTSQTISVARGGLSGHFGAGAWVFTGASGSVANGSGNRTEAGFTFTPTAGSAVVYFFADWNANATDQTLATGTGTKTERADSASSQWGWYAGEWVNVTASSTTFGVTSYTGLKVGHVVLEILASASGVTGTAAETQDNQTSTASGWITVTGTAVETQANQTSTATGVLGYTGTSARTQANQTASAAGWITVTGTAVETQDAQTSTATGVLGYSGTSARTQANQTATASGTVAAPGISGSVAETQDNQTSTATGILGYSGTSARTQANQTSTATGILGYTGTSSRTQANQTSAASGTVSGAGVAGSVAVTQGNQSSAATGVLGYTGTSARTQANQTANAVGYIPITGTVARTQGNQAANASGTVAGVVTPLPVLPLYAFRSHGVDGYRVGEKQTVFIPHTLKSSSPLVVVVHGVAANAAWYAEDMERYRPLEAIAETGMVVVAGDLGAAGDGWGNPTQVTRIGEVITWAGTTFDCDTSRVHLVADSAGGAGALNWARANNNRVGGIALRAGVCDVDAIYTGGNPGLATLIDIAYGGNWNVAKATSDPALNTAELVPVAARIRCYYSSGDTIVPAAPTLEFCADVGCQAVPIGAMPHGDLIMTGIQDGDLVSWLWSLNAA
jgi:pimeloyl-ACP methyl ester carboxylesterase